MSVIATDGLGKRYGRSITALEGLTIDVEPGEIFGFLGPNGAGKSTTIRLLLGFLHPTAGRATVFGLDTERSSVEIRARVGYLPGGIALYDSLTGHDLLAYLADLYDRPAPDRAELVDRFEFSDRDLRRPVRDYSRGMRQKIGIVQALQHDPELAILDEPTEGLDPLMQRAFYGILLVARAVRGGARVRPGRDHPQGPSRGTPGRRRAPRAAQAECRNAARRSASLARRRPGRIRGHGPRRPAHLPPRRRRRAIPPGDRRGAGRRPDDRAGAPRGGVPRVLRGGARPRAGSPE
ncbi:MAG: ABC transporter ATP-binding protein [Chloroflexi bacterium]|nr:MAG: ABC transporter ATP-binding protein [Chloroflexota bacterium]